MIPRPPRSPRTDTLFPYTTLFRALVPCIDAKRVRDGDREANGGLPPLVPAIPVRDGDDQLVLSVGGVGRVDIEHVVAVAIDVLAVGGAAAHRSVTHADRGTADAVDGSRGHVHDDPLARTADGRSTRGLGEGGTREPGVGVEPDRAVDDGAVGLMDPQPEAVRDRKST